MAIYESFNLKVSKWDVVEDRTFNGDEEKELILATAPDITYGIKHNDNMHSYKEIVETIKKDNEHGKVVYRIHHYNAIRVLMNNLEHLLVDGRELWKIKHGISLERLGVEEVTTYDTIVVVDDDHAFKKSFDDIPGVMHDVESYEKEHFEDKDETQEITDKDELLYYIVNESPMVYKLASEALRNDSDVIATMCKSKHWMTFELLPDGFINNKENIREAIRDKKLLPIERFNKEVLKDILSDISFIEDVYNLDKSWFNLFFNCPKHVDRRGAFNYNLIQDYATDEVKKKIEELTKQV